jgi:predicted transcriptional regulator of viral defense system
MATRFQRQVAYREAFLARLSARVAAPSDEWPTVRCWTVPSFRRLARGIRADLAAEGMHSDVTSRALLGWLERLGLAKRIAADGETFYLLEFGQFPNIAPDPPELLLAACPTGVICDFTAVDFHNLTTQPVTHHHVALLHDDPAPEPPQRPPPPAGNGPVPLARLGRLLFRHEGAAYYRHRRPARLVPGVHRTWHGPRVILRLTTLEQTLLDTLSRPFRCGGPEVVFEAWQEACESNPLDESLLADYLTRLDSTATTRRVGVMLGLVEHTPGAALRRVLDEARAGLTRAAPRAPVPGLPGMGYTRLDTEWLVHTP